MIIAVISVGFALLCMGWFSYIILSGKVDAFIIYINKTAYINDDERINRKRMRIVITAFFWEFAAIFSAIRLMPKPENPAITPLILFGAIALIYIIANILGKTWCMRK
ncbi:MAG: hypothetical protein J6U04_01865 [Salinivirgaceae bacterium]|nr:hypothetical protein [Salinivirgaceae bacterium]